MHKIQVLLTSVAVAAMLPVLAACAKESASQRGQTTIQTPVPASPTADTNQSGLTTPPSAPANAASPTTVKAPFSRVESSGNGQAQVSAPFTRVQTDESTGSTTLKAPFVKVETEQGQATKIRAPFVKIDRVGDKIHIRAPFVDTWKNARPPEGKKRTTAAGEED